MMGAAARHHVLCCAASTALGHGLNRCCETLGPRRWMRDVMGTPWYSWRIGSLHQAFVFPPLLLLSLRAWFATHDGALSDWLHSSWASNAGSPAHAAFHYAFFGYLMKDMFVKMSAVFYAHHVLCLVLTVMSIAEVPNPCSAVYVLMVTNLEAGSMALSVHRQFPASAATSWFSLVVMTFSNVFGASFAIWYGLYFRFGSLAGRWSLTVIGVVLMYMRQEVELKRWHEVHVLKRPLKDRTL